MQQNYCHLKGCGVFLIWMVGPARCGSRSAGAFSSCCSYASSSICTCRVSTCFAASHSQKCALRTPQIKMPDTNDSTVDRSFSKANARVSAPATSTG